MPLLLLLGQSPGHATPAPPNVDRIASVRSHLVHPCFPVLPPCAARAHPPTFRCCLGWLSQEYVLEQIRQFAVEFAQQLVPQITQQHLDLAFSRALYALSARSSQQALKLQLRFTHKCK